MRVLGFEITRAKPRTKAILSQPVNRGGWLPIIFESFAGAFQTNVVVDRDTAMTHFAVFSCMTLIAGDIAKLEVRLERRQASGVWSETNVASFSPVLRKPNDMQTRIQFWEHYMLSKLANGNVYVLKERDNRNVVIALYILDPTRVQPLVSPAGDVFYRLSTDNISGLEHEITVPASEIVHDRFNCLFHPLIGMSPLLAAGLAAMQGINIQNDSAVFFANRAMPSGMLTAPGVISNDTATRLKEYWDTNFGGENRGKVAVAGDGLKFEQLRSTARDSELVEQLKFTAEMVCSAYHVPPFKIGVGPLPSYNNVQALNIMYYQQALQVLIEGAEACMKDALALPDDLRVTMDEDGLLRMDTASLMDVLEKSKSVLTLDERRRRLDAEPIEGGDTVYLQQQDHSIEAIAARDRLLIDQANNPAPPAPPAPPPAAPPVDDGEEERVALALLAKDLRDELFEAA